MTKDEGNKEVKKEIKKKKELHYKPTNPYLVHNPESGYAYAFITTSDSRQYNAAIGLGWEPVKASDEPELFNGGGYVNPKTGCYQYRELVVCKIPENVMVERKAEMKRLTEERSARVADTKQYMKQHKHITAEITNKPESFVVSD